MARKSSWCLSCQRILEKSRVVSCRRLKYGLTWSLSHDIDIKNKARFSELLMVLSVHAY